MHLVILSAFLILLATPPNLTVLIDEEYDESITQPLVDKPSDDYFINSTHTRLGKIGSTMICLINKSTLGDANATFQLTRHLDGDMCTHAIFAYAKLCGNETICGLDRKDESTVSKDWRHTFGVHANDTVAIAMEEVFGNLPELLSDTHNLRIGVSIGGWAEGSERFGNVTSDLWSRFRFVKNVVNKLKSYNMTAVELAWFAPTIRYAGKPQDRQNYVELLKEFYEEAKKLNFHVGVAIQIIDGDVDPYYDILSLSPFVDWIRVEAHNFHTYFEEFSGFNAPLFGKKGDTKTVANWIRHVAILSDPRKIVLDLPLYGLTWLLAEEPIPGGPGSPSLGTFTDEPKLKYNEVCSMFQSNGTPPWIFHWDPVSMTPWAIRKLYYISYDNERSLKAKVEFAVSRNLAGVAIHSVDNDDFEGNCGKGKMPLLTAIKLAVDTTKRNVKIKKT